ncbi:flotillin domain-containing protein, partial [Enterococcus hirae]|uniref:flotillin domain-containing protein n=1 Tax=Enterococcus hirae TaxID=1354 RepID=UPI002555E17B
FRVEALAQAEANKTRLAGQAEAEATLAKGAAEAEAKAKIADAFKEYGEAAVLSMVIEMLPQLMKEAAQPLGNIEKISVVDTSNGSSENGGANRVTNYATNLLASTQETLKETTGLDIKLITHLPTPHSKTLVANPGSPPLKKKKKKNNPTKTIKNKENKT